ncbi:acyl carrier protein [Paraglaciecola sp.]|uniref:acyl carrier protein n=1 Tax=Paraglaciecola sp. TaxID=1920173 RepID=UPI0030F46B89
MNTTEIKTTIEKFFKEKPVLEGISQDQDFFESGASSLTIVDMQIQIEKAIGVAVETHKLMANPTIKGWVELYGSQAVA